MKTLPPPPATLKKRTLTDPEWDYLFAKFGNALPKDPSDCPTCRGTGSFLHMDTDETYQCDCTAQWQMFMLLTYAGIEKRYQQYSWANTENVNPEVLASVRTYVNGIENFIQAGIGLLLFGDNKGTGKTLLSTLVLKHAIARGYEGFFIEYHKLIDLYTSTWGGNRNEQGLFDQRVRNVQVLVVDDVGRESANRNLVADEMFDTILRTRVAAMRPTIITTNLSMEKLSSRYSENVVSLLTETALDFHVVGTDYRQHSRNALLEQVARGGTRPVTFG